MKYIFEYKSLKIRSFKRNGRKRPIDMLEIIVGNKYRKVVDDVRIHIVKKMENTIKEIMELNTFDDDKCFLISECVYMDVELFREKLDNYIEKSFDIKTKYSFYRLDVDIILPKTERDLIWKEVSSWEWHGTGYKCKGNYTYYLPAHVLYNNVSKIPVDGYLYELKKIKEGGEI